jgi:hypothetical protein
VLLSAEIRQQVAHRDPSDLQAYALYFDVLAAAARTPAGQATLRSMADLCAALAGGNADGR